jgi:signal transduction histidine kinase
MESKSAPTLKRGITQALSVLVGITVLVSAALVGITSVLHDTTETLSSSMETIRLVKDAQRDLLLHAQSHDDVARSVEASELRSQLFEGRRFVSTDEESRAFDAAEHRVNEYLNAGPDERERLEPAAYEELGNLVRINLSQAAAAQQRASRLDTIANIVAFATALAAVTGAFIFGWWVRTRALRPVLGLARAMQNFGQGNESERAPEGGPEEIREMGRQFNGMADRLLEQRSAHRTYLAAVAHDLRNPLGTLRLAVDTFSGETVTDATRLQRMINIVRRQIDRLTRLSEDLLDTTHLESGQIELVLGAHDLREVLRSTAELFSTASSRHSIDLCLPEEAAIVTCDAQRMEQVFANLVGNAIKYSPNGGTVRVTLACRFDKVEIAVEDHGVGMTPEEIEKSFQPFTRAQTLRRSVPGHGLGLFIVQRIVKEHGGTLSVESTPGVGSVFRVELPANQRSALAPQHAIH